MTTHDPDDINWHAAAERLAAGGDAAAAAVAAGCSEMDLHRKLRTDGVLSALVDCYRQTPAVRGEDHRGTLRTLSGETIEREVRAGNLKVVMWFADRVRLLRPEAEDAHDGPLDVLSPDEAALLAGLDRYADGLD